MTKGARWKARSFKNVRNSLGVIAKCPEDNAQNLSDYFQDIFDPVVQEKGWDEVERMEQLPELLG